MRESHEAIVWRWLAVGMTLQFALGGAVLPFLSIYLQDQGLDYRQISRVFFTSSASLLIFPFLWGMVADRYLPLNRVFTILNVLALGALYLLSQQTTFLGLLLCVTALIACFNPTLMLFNPLSFHHLKNPREQFGALRAWGSLGWILPSLPIGAWLALRENQDLSFVLHLGMGLGVGMAVISFWLPHTPPGAARSVAGGAIRNPREGRGASGEEPGGQGRQEPVLGYWPAMKSLLRNGSYVTILTSFFLIAGSFSIFVFYSPPQLERLGMARAWIGPVQCIGVVLEIILFRWRSLFVHRWSYATTILIGCLALALRQLLFAFVDNLWILAASYLLAGMVIVFFHIGASLLVNTIAGPEVRSTAQTLLVLCGSGLGPMFGNWAVGLLTGGSRQDLRVVFLFAACLAGLAALLIFLRGTRLDRDAREQR